MHGWIRIAVVWLVVALVVGTGAPALAHEGHGADEDSAEHAAEDMADVSISTIKALTRGTARAAGYAGIAAAADAAAPAGAGVGGDPSAVGRWDPTVYKTPVVPVFSAVLPDGKVLMWDSVGDQGVETYADQSYTRAAVWDPTTNTSKDVRLDGYNIFCAGFVQLPNGDVLVAGGNKNQQQEGIKQTHIFHWQSETWERGPDMSSERWYPSLVALGDGNALIASGQDPVTPLPPDQDTTVRKPELYVTAANAINQLGFDSFSNREYPFLVPRTDGKVEEVGPEQHLFRYDLNAQTNTDQGQRDASNAYRNYGSFAPFLPDQVLVSGGGTHNTPAEVNSNSSSVVVDLAQAATTPVREVASMAVGRRQHTLTILADGSVLATGGMNSASELQVDLPAAVFAAERWDPATGQWTTLASEQRIREYHSSAVLLPDGRVMSGGGGICTACVAAGYFEQNVEYFSPPSLYADSCTPANRPGLAGVPNQMGNGAPFSFTSPAAGDIAKLGIIRLSADTHGVNQGQRYVPLSFSTSGTTITANGPIDGNTAPPGYYLMYGVTTSGVPSAGAIVHVGSFGVPAPGVAPVFSTPTDSLCPAAAPARPGPARCLQIRNARSGKSAVVRGSCSETNRTWKLKKKDGTLRAAGRCLSFSSLSKGAKVQATRCGKAKNQRIVLRKKTIRPAAAQGLCVTSAHSGKRLGDRLVLQPCEGKRGSGRQRWTT